jgi:hypothetical protein
MQKTTRCHCLALVLLVCTAADARCTSKDRWRGFDKGEHLLSGAVFGMAFSYGTGNPWAGLGAAAAVGVAKEALDAQGGGTCSLQDLMATIAGGALGVAWYGWSLRFTAGRPQITHSWELK